MKLWIFIVWVGLWIGLGITESQAAPVPFTKADLATNTEWLSAHRPAQPQGAGRAPAAQAGLDLSTVAPEYFALVHRILDIRKPEQIDQLISTLEATYDQLDPNSKWIALHLIAIKNLRGIVFRAMPIAQKNHTVLSFALRQLKTAREEAAIQCPGAHCQAFMDYLTFPKNAQVNRFSEISQLLDFSVVTFIPDMRTMTTRLQDLAARAGAAPLLADLRILQGWDGKDDNKSGALSPYQRIVTPAALNAEISQIFQWGVHGLLLADAYDLDRIPDLYANIGQLFGLDGFLLDPTDGVTTQDWVGVFRKHEFSKLFTIRVDAVPSLQAAYGYLKTGNDFWDYSLTLMKAQLDAGIKIEGSLLRPEAFWASPSRTELTTKNQFDLVNGVASLRSMVSGEVVQINLPKFYNEPPQDFKTFLPTSFDRGPTRYDVKLGDGSVVKNYWNLPAGRAIGWNDKAYCAYFTCSTPARSPKDFVRILRESMGGEDIASLLSHAVY